MPNELLTAIVQQTEAGAPALAAPSTATALKQWLPTARFSYSAPPEQAVAALPSSWHRKVTPCSVSVKCNSAWVWNVGLSGAPVMTGAGGATVSMRKPAVSVWVWAVALPSVSVARTETTYGPSVRLDRARGERHEVVPLAVWKIWDARVNPEPLQYLPLDCCKRATWTLATPVASLAVPHTPGDVGQPAFHAAAS